MQHFVSKLQFRIQISNQQLAQQFEEITILVKALNKQEAYSKAFELGRKNEDEFVNENQNKVCWIFEGITHLFQVLEPEHGTVLFSELKDDFTPEQLDTNYQRIRKIKETFISNFLHTN